MFVSSIQLCIWLRSLKNSYKASYNQLLFTAMKNIERSRQKNCYLFRNCVTTIKSLSSNSFKRLSIVKKEYNSSRSRVRNNAINYALHALGDNVERIECSLFLRRFSSCPKWLSFSQWHIVLTLELQRGPNC